MKPADPRTFPHGDEFIPERWTTRPELVKDATVYSPFSVGRFSCVGKQLGKQRHPIGLISATPSLVDGWTGATTGTLIYENASRIDGSPSSDGAHRTAIRRGAGPGADQGGLPGWSQGQLHAGHAEPRPDLLATGWLSRNFLAPMDMRCPRATRRVLAGLDWTLCELVLFVASLRSDSSAWWTERLPGGNSPSVATGDVPCAIMRR